MKRIPTPIEDREILDTKSMLETAFFSNLQATGLNPPLPEKEIKTAEKSVEKSVEGIEDLLLDLYDVRDNLISLFKDIDYTSDIAQSLVSNINKTGNCIKRLGGKVEDFVALKHISGLKAPSQNLIIARAEKVIENTKYCYELGDVEPGSVSDNGKRISLSFKGKHSSGTHFMAVGTITAKKGWVGSEAIDYIYTPGEGKMSVKVFENDQWIDKSDDKAYDIFWELTEWEPSAENKIVEAEIKDVQKEEKKIEEVQNNTQNNMDKENDISDNFPIEEKK